MKKILFIGAGFLQSFVIKKAREMGYYTLALDADSNAPGFAYSDEYEVIDIIDREACLAFARKNNVDGVLTVATEYGVLTAAYIAEEMMLPGLNYDTAKLVKNKYLTRKCLIENKADDYDSSVYLVENENDIQKLADILCYPVIIKPCEGSGSRGIGRVDSPAGLYSACMLAMRSSVTKSALIEAFVEGHEYGAESIVVNNEIHVLSVMKKEMTRPPYYAELGHVIPCGLSADTEERAKECISRAIASLGINSGAVNADILITDDGKIYIVDIGARMGGNLIGTCVIPYGTGIDYMSAVIKNAVGEKVDLVPSPHGAVATGIMAFPDKIVKRLPVFEQIEKKYDVEIYHHLNIGQVVHEYHTNLDGCGYIVARSDDVDTAQNHVRQAFDELKRSIFDDENI